MDCCNSACARPRASDAFVSAVLSFSLSNVLAIELSGYLDTGSPLLVAFLPETFFSTSPTLLFRDRLTDESRGGGIGAGDCDVVFLAVESLFDLSRVIRRRAVGGRDGTGGASCRPGKRGSLLFVGGVIELDLDPLMILGAAAGRTRPGEADDSEVAGVPVLAILHGPGELE